MGLHLVLNAWGKTYEVQLSLINNTENQVRTWAIKDSIQVPLSMATIFCSKQTNKQIKQKFCSKQVRRPVGSRRQNIWDGGCIEKLEIQLTKLSILGPSLFPQPSHNTISPQILRRIYMSVFSLRNISWGQIGRARRSCFEGAVRTERQRQRDKGLLKIIFF